MKNKLAVLLAAILILFSACNSRPEIVIEEETMVSLLTDIHMAEGLLEVQSSQSRDEGYAEGVRSAVLAKYDITQERLDTSLVWYSQNLKYLIRIYNRVNKNLEEREEQWNLAANEAETFGKSASGDSVNLWRISPNLIMDDYRRLAHRQWRIASDTAYHAGDTIRWSMHIPDLPAGEYLQASLAISKNGDKNINTKMDGITTDKLCRDTTITLTCIADSGVMIATIFASLDLLPIQTCDTNQVAASDSLVQTSRPRGMTPIFVEDISLIRLHSK